MTNLNRAALAAGVVLLLGISPAANAGPAKVNDANQQAAANAAAFFSQLSFLRPTNPVLKSKSSENGNVTIKPAVAGRSSHDGLIARYAAAEGVPLALAHAVIKIESNYRANAHGSAGEVGLMQIKPATARGMGFRGAAKALYDPATNLRWGMKYLGKAHQLGGGQTCGTILRYNAGHGAKRMNKVSAAYCSKVKRQLTRA